MLHMLKFGHRTRNHKGWVQGRFMLTISEQELKMLHQRDPSKETRKEIGGSV